MNGYQERRIVTTGPLSDTDLVSPDAVNHPPHYQSNGMEVIDVIEAFDLNFRLGNAVKYLLRAGRKGDRCQDFEKAIWYIRREIEKGGTK